MSNIVELWEIPKAEEVFLICGWRQWADAGSVSSGLPLYLKQEENARRIGKINDNGFYLFQIPGTHSLVRPVVQFEDGFPKSLDVPKNEIFYYGDEKRGVVILLGEEPHLDAERYVQAILELSKTLNIKRIISVAGVYGELPHDKERMVSAIYSQATLKSELDELAVRLSDYHGGASIGSYLCKRAADEGIEYVGLYAFVPTYDFSNIAQVLNAIRIENDFMAWHGIIRRLNHMIKINFDVSDLEEKNKKLISTIENRIEELESKAPQSGIRDYINRIADEFTEVSFNPLGDVWESELKRLLDEPDEE